MASNPSFILPTVQKSTVVFNEFVKIRRDDLLLPNNTMYAYYSLIPRGDAVVIVGLTSEGLFVLNEEYRPPTGKILLSCPGGYIDHDDPLNAAEREFLEETGYTAKSFTLLGSAFPYPGISAQKVYYVLAQEAEKKSEPHREPSEIMRTILKSEQDVKASISSGCDVDGTLCTALFFYSISDQSKHPH